MSTPIFDTLYAESDEATRAIVWDAVRPVSLGIPDPPNWTAAIASALANVADVAAIEVSQ